MQKVYQEGGPRPQDVYHVRVRAQRKLEELLREAGQWYPFEGVVDPVLPENDVIRREAWKRLQELISMLPDEKQTILRMSDEEGMTIREIADALSRQPSRIWQLLNSARSGVRIGMEHSLFQRSDLE